MGNWGEKNIHIYIYIYELTHRWWFQIFAYFLGKQSSLTIIVSNGLKPSPSFGFGGRFVHPIFGMQLGRSTPIASPSEGTLLSTDSRVSHTRCKHSLVKVGHIIPISGVDRPR